MPATFLKLKHFLNLHFLQISINSISQFNAELLRMTIIFSMGAGNKGRNKAITALTLEFVHKTLIWLWALFYPEFSPFSQCEQNVYSIFIMTLTCISFPQFGFQRYESELQQAHILSH